jgi:hypothetical protein
MSISFIPKHAKSTRTSGGGSWVPKSKLPQQEDAPSAPKDKFLPTLKPVTEVAKPKQPEVAKLSLDSLTSAQQTALEALPGPAANALHRVWDVADRESSRAQILQLLENGTMAQEDQGQTVAQSLAKLTDSRRGSGIDPETLTRQSIALLAEPDKTTHQGINTYTCGAASLQYEMSQKRPALLARFIEDVTDQDASMTFPEGEVFQRPAGSEHDDNSGRTSLNRLLQGTLMAYTGAARGAYDPSTDTFGGKKDEYGLKIIEVAKTAALLDGEKKLVVHHNSDSSKEFHRIMKSSKPDDNFQVGLSWNDQDHLVVFTGLEDGQATFFNAQDTSTDSMPIDDFLFKTQFAILPADRVDTDKLPEDSVFDPDVHVPS